MDSICVRVILQCLVLDSVENPIDYGRLPWQVKAVSWPHDPEAGLDQKQQGIQASFDILPSMPLCIRRVEDMKMSTEAQMRSPPADFRGCQPAVSPKRVIHRQQRSHLKPPFVGASSSCKHFKKRLGSQGERTRQGFCAATNRDTQDESIGTPSSQQLSGSESKRDQHRSLPVAAALVGVVVVLSAMAVPAPADAAEAVPLEFLSKFLVRYLTWFLQL